MRILGITNLYPNPFQPNRSTFNRQQFRAMAAAGSAVRVIAPIAWTDELAARRNGAAPLPAGRRVTTDGITVDHPRYLFTPKVLRNRYGNWFLRCVRPAFRRALEEFRPEIVYATWAYPDGWAAVRLARDAGLPVVIKVHGSDVLLLDDHPAKRARTVEALRAADGVVSVSRDIADRMAGFGVDRERIRVVYSGVDTDRFHPRPRDAARARLGLAPCVPTVLYVGNLVPVKGLPTLLEAVAALAKQVPDLRCVLVGQGTQRPELERQAAQLGIAGRVQFAGARPHDELPDWFAAADVMALPSRSEGVPNVLLEAAACGTPFVASRVGGIPEIAHLGRSRLVAPGDAAALSEAIRQSLAESREAVRATPSGGFRGHAQAAAEISEFLEEVARAHAAPRLAPAPAAAASGGGVKLAGCAGVQS